MIILEILGRSIIQDSRIAISIPLSATFNLMFIDGKVVMTTLFNQF